MKHKVLVLGGTNEAKKLCTKLACKKNFDVVVSIAGIVAPAADYSVTLRIGGFGGTSGMVDYIISNNIKLIADITHPFATKITDNAIHACRFTQTPYIGLQRPKWTQQVSDKWIETDDVGELFHQLPTESVVFAPMGSGMFKPKNLSLFESRSDVRFYLRSIMAPEVTLPKNILQVILGMPPFTLKSEKAILRRINADCLMCRNSGGRSGEMKIEAARQLNVAIFLLMGTPPRIKYQNVDFFHDVEQVKIAICNILDIS